ncbi:hypothetical protein NUW58_g4509 [Xylaria curta]|uniref:Uncharacterized protein n=1 Tax=Xylaria curta TaxID=42375 RepID=A0ACC1P6Z2_9PEZI|nr:hypothetical protein NUW58_g4509 [Xylaria curta]
MDEETLSLASDVNKTRDASHDKETSKQAEALSSSAGEKPLADSESQSGDGRIESPTPSESSGRKSETDSKVETAIDTEQGTEQQELHPSIETDDDADVTRKDVDGIRAASRSSSRRTSKKGEPIEHVKHDIASRHGHENLSKDEEIEEHSILSEGTDRSFELDGEQSYVDHSKLGVEGTSHTSDAAPRVGDGDESSSQQGGTDEDVFTDKSPRSSMGSCDASSESGKGADTDNMTTITHSSRISDISQYDKEDFIPTARGTPRPPFRTPSDVRALQMSSPPTSVLGSPRSSRKHFPTASRLGTPSASAQYSPKRKSTPPRFKTRHEAPLVLLHVTLLPLRWMWGDLVNNLDPVEMSEQAKTLRNSWRILQDRVGDTVIERGILLGHPQNDYEVLEERLLEALDLPVRRRARILECGHYLGPSNEATITEDEESEDDYSQHRRQSASQRHWCATCKSEIRYDSLGEVKVFRVKVYASNGLMRAGAWEACWKEMERVDVELEPIVEPMVQDEIVRLAAAQQEREIAQQEEAEIAKEVALQYEEQRRSEEHLLRQQAQAQLQSSPPPEPEVVPEPIHEPIHESRSSRRRQRDEERLREIYGQTPPPPESHDREPSSHHHPDSYIPPPSPPSPTEEANERRESRRRGYQSASLPELLLQSARVLMQDRKNVIIVTLSLFVLVLSLRSTPPEPPYEPIIHRLKPMPEIQQLSVADAPAIQEQRRSIEDGDREPIMGPLYREAFPSYEVPHSEPSQQSSPNSEYHEVSYSIEQPAVASAVSHAVSQEAQDTSTTPTSVSTIYEPCESPVDSSMDLQASAVASDASEVQETIQEIVQETVHEIETATEKKVVKVIQTVTQTQTHTQTQTETQTEFETVMVQATEVPEPETPSNTEKDKITEKDYNFEAEAESTAESQFEPTTEPTAEPTTEPADGSIEV